MASDLPPESSAWQSSPPRHPGAHVAATWNTADGLHVAGGHDVTPRMPAMRILAGQPVPSEPSGRPRVSTVGRCSPPDSSIRLPASATAWIRSQGRLVTMSRARSARPPGPRQGWSRSLGDGRPMGHPRQLWAPRVIVSCTGLGARRRRRRHERAACAPLIAPCAGLDHAGRGPRVGDIPGHRAAEPNDDRRGRPGQ